MQVDVDSWKGKCLVCGEEVTYPNWKCSKRPGNHRLADQTYFHLGGSHLQNWRERRGWGPLVILRPGQETADPRNPKNLILTATLKVRFDSQQVVTNDPEMQFLLETKNDACIAWGPEGKKAWERIYLTPDQQKDMAKAELETLSKQIAEQNELLASVQKRNAGKVVHA